MVELVQEKNHLKREIKQNIALAKELKYGTIAKKEILTNYIVVLYFLVEYKLITAVGEAQTSRARIRVPKEAKCAAKRSIERSANKKRGHWGLRPKRGRCERRAGTGI